MYVAEIEHVQKFCIIERFNEMKEYISQLMEMDEEGHANAEKNKTRERENGNEKQGLKVLL